MKTIYLSGPMTGLPHCNFPAFHAAANFLRLAGFAVLNPADFGERPELEWAECVKRDLIFMFNADVVVTLAGWEKSPGAGLETHVAQALGIPVKTYQEFLRETIHATQS